MAWSAAQSGNMNPGRSVFFPGMAVGSGVVTGNSGVFIPFSVLESYNLPNSGEIGELVYSIVDKFYSGMASLSGDDLPTKFTVTRQTALTSDTTASKNFGITFNLNVSNAKYDLQSET